MDDKLFHKIFIISILINIFTGVITNASNLETSTYNYIFQKTDQDLSLLSKSIDEDFKKDTTLLDKVTNYIPLGDLIAVGKVIINMFSDLSGASLYKIALENANTGFETMLAHMLAIFYLIINFITVKGIWDLIR